MEDESITHITSNSYDWFIAGGEKPKGPNAGSIAP